MFWFSLSFWFWVIDYFPDYISLYCCKIVILLPFFWLVTALSCINVLKYYGTVWLNLIEHTFFFFWWSWWEKEKCALIIVYAVVVVDSRWAECAAWALLESRTANSRLRLAHLNHRRRRIVQIQKNCGRRKREELSVRQVLFWAKPSLSRIIIRALRSNPPLAMSLLLK